MRLKEFTLHRRFADNTNGQSISVRLRRQRFQILLNMLRDIPRPVTILDIGGRQKYWEMMGLDLLRNPDLQITLLNTEAQSVSLANFSAVSGDGRSMPQFSDKQFAIVFSNSTIEHVGPLEDQERMSQEVRRVGKKYYVQTPNRYFPIEPHFIFPFFQFFPVSWRAWLLQHFNLGWYSKIPDREQALTEVTRIRLMTKTELERIFPDANIFEEKVCGMTKSFVAYTAPQS